VRMPWADVPGDDGAARSLSIARWVCGAALLLPAALVGVSLTLLAAPGASPHEEPILSAALAVIALLMAPVAPFARDGVARRGIGEHLREAEAGGLGAEAGGPSAVGAPGATRRLPIYASFIRAALAAFAIALLPAVFGFIVTVTTRSTIAIGIGTVVSYAACLGMWPRKMLWTKWLWQARIGRSDETAVS
jgi:hypothetical protein